MKKNSSYRNPMSLASLVPMAMLATTLLVPLGAVAWAIEPLRVQHQWELDPKLDSKWALENFPAIQAVKIELLDSTFDLDRLKAAQWAGYAARNKLAVEPGSFERLLKAIQSADINPQLRQACISSAADIAGQENVAELWKAISSDSRNAHLGERALVRLRHPAARDIWRQRLNDEIVSRNWLLACEGLAATGDESDAALLVKQVRRDKLPVAYRIAAAKALGTVAKLGQHPFATQILGSNLEHRHLIAAHILRSHSGDVASPILQRIIAEGPTTAQGVAYAALCKSAPNEARKLAPQMVSHAENTIRQSTLDLLQTFSDMESLDLQSNRLADTHSALRNLARNQLLAKYTADEKLRPKLLAYIDREMASNDWHGIEQAILLAAEISDHARCEKLIELLEHPVVDVNVTAAWSLRILANSPEIYGQMLEHAVKWTDRLSRLDPATHDDFHRLAHLLEALGDRHYEPVEPILQKYVPKGDFRMGYVSRMSGIWALGKYWKDGDNYPLAQKLAERAADKLSANPEMDGIRYAATIAIGFIADERSREELIANAEPLPNPCGYATQWALERLDKKKKP